MSNFPPPPGPGNPPGPDQPGGGQPGPFGPPAGFPPGFPSGPPQSGFGPSPLTPSQFSVITPGPPDSPPPVWKKWWFVVGCLVVIGGIITAVVVATSDDDKTRVAEDFDPDDVTIPSISIPDISIPQITIPDISIPEITVPDITLPITVPDITTEESTGETTEETTDETTGDTTEETTDDTATPHNDLVVGETATVENGATVRLNSVTPNAPLIDDFFEPDPGHTLTRLDVEGCAGSEPLYLNSLYWLGFLEDNTTVDAFIFGGDLTSLSVAPGACIRGLIDLQVPDGHTVADVVMQGSFFDEVARWDTSSSVPVTGPLTAADPVTPLGLNEPVTLPDGSTATVRSVTPNAPPIDEFFPAEEGRQLVRADVEVCAGSTSLSVNPSYWFAAATDNRTGAATFGGSTLPTIELAAGECAAGLVEIDLPADATVATIIFADTSLVEAARFRAA